MNPIQPQTTLGELVTRHPALAAELERRGLDYCCGGSRSLDDACAGVGLDARTVASELTQRVATGDAPPPEWATMDAATLVDHLEAVHHRYLWDELPRLTALGTKVLGVHGGNHPELAAVAGLVDDLRADLEPHLTKEERVLFPMIRELATADVRPTFHCGSIGAPISVMLREHDRAGELLANLRAVTDDYRVPDDGCASYRALYAGLAAIEADTHLHVHKENNVLFPMVLAREAQLEGSPAGA